MASLLPGPATALPLGSGVQDGSVDAKVLQAPVEEPLPPSCAASLPPSCMVSSTSTVHGALPASFQVESEADSEGLPEAGEYAGRAAADSADPDRRWPTVTANGDGRHAEDADDGSAGDAQAEKTTSERVERAVNDDPCAEARAEPGGGLLGVEGDYVGLPEEVSSWLDAIRDEALDEAVRRALHSQNTRARLHRVRVRERKSERGERDAHNTY
jgi:hypothetical protein